MLSRQQCDWKTNDTYWKKGILGIYLNCDCKTLETNPNEVDIVRRDRFRLVVGSKCPICLPRVWKLTSHSRGRTGVRTSLPAVGAHNDNRPAFTVWAVDVMSLGGTAGVHYVRSWCESVFISIIPQCFVRSPLQLGLLFCGFVLWALIRRVVSRNIMVLHLQDGSLLLEQLGPMACVHAVVWWLDQPHQHQVWYRGIFSYWGVQIVILIFIIPIWVHIGGLEFNKS